MKADSSFNIYFAIRVLTIALLCSLLISAILFLGIASKQFIYHSTNSASTSALNSSHTNPNATTVSLNNLLSGNLSLTDITNTLTQRTKVLLLSTWLLLFVVVTALFIWLNWHSPVKQLTQYMQQISDGTFNFPVLTHGSKRMRNLASALDKLRSMLAQKDKQQKDFLQHISHELKTPLASIKEGTSLLNDNILGTLNNDQQEIIAILKDNTAELQNSIENLLNYNEVQSTSHVKCRVSCNLTNLLRKSIKKHKIQIKSKNISVTLRSDEISAFIDKEQVFTVFNNLLSNAIKFSKQNGFIALILKKDGNQAVFSIADEGYGIKQEDENHIFDAFYIGEQPHQHSLRGTGLGLSIAKKYVELNDGTIRLIQNDVGAKFEVKFKI